MDWSKTKNYLIVGLLLANAFLIFNLGFSYFESNSGIDSENMSNLESILKKKNLTLGKIDNFNSVLVKDVFIAYEIFNPLKIADNIYGDSKKPIYSGFMDGYSQLTFKEGNRSLEYLKNGEEIYNDKVLNWSYSTEYSSDEKTAREFINKMGFDDKKIKVTKEAYHDGRRLIVFDFTDGDVNLDKNDIIVSVKGNEVRSLFMREPKITISPVITEITTTPFQAIMKFYRKYQDSGKVVSIERVDLVYRFSVSDASQIIKSADALAYWRIYTKDAKVYYIEAVSL